MVLDIHKKKEEKREMTLRDIAEKHYLDNVQEYITFNENFYRRLHLIDKKQPEMLMNEYNTAVSEIVNYLLNKFPESTLNGSNSIEIETTDMNENLSNQTFNMLRAPIYPSIIDIKRSTYSAHFHIEGQIVSMAEDLQSLKGINPLLKNEKINKIFEGLNIKEARALLKQMNILPVDNDIDPIIINHDERTKIYNNFLKSIIYSLLSKANTMADIRRAHLFAASFGIDFNFEPYENLIAEEYKLKLNKNC